MQASQRDAVSYGEHLKKTSGNISSLNSAYELQLQTINNTNKSYANFEKAISALGETSQDAQKVKQHMASLSDNLASLNTVYGNMLTAMSPLRK